MTEAESPIWLGLRGWNGSQAAYLGSSTPSRSSRPSMIRHDWEAWLRTEDVARTVDARVILFQCPKSFLPTSCRRSLRAKPGFRQHLMPMGEVRR